MDNFIVSARKYRPATFDTVVGQDSITNTLKNAIRSKHLAQAFLFCGPRGVGKTTCARILAKTINCFNLTPEGEACGNCESCNSFQDGHSLNIFELDAASNNSVDDIRSLVDQVRVAPQLGDKKVYIIDEVHMLSQAAFNAFLKTLEEPPAHAIFILATTEKHKIIPTILSRCQIFDFSRIQIHDIANHLAKIGLSEGIDTEFDGLMQIAAKADGGLRDALSMFDQIVTCAGNVTYKAVIDNLNILDYDYYFKLTDSVLSMDISNTLLTFNEILSNGFDGNNFIIGLGEHFRNLLVCKDNITIQLLSVSDETKGKYQTQSERCTQHFLISALEICNKCDLNYKISKNQRLLVELALLQLCSLHTVVERKVQNFIVSPPYHIKKEAPKAQTPIAPKAVTEAPTEAPQQEAVVDVKQAIKEIAATNFPKIEIDKGVEVKQKFGSWGSVISGDKPSIKELTNLAKSTEQKQKEVLTQQAEELLESAVIEENTNIAAEPATEIYFGEKQLTEAWAKFAETMQAPSKKNILNGLLQAKLKINDDYTIEIAVLNKLQEKDFTDIKTDITQFLRVELQNNSIKLNIIVVEEKMESVIVNKSEVLKKLIAKNPNLKGLIDMLGLQGEV